jgi:UDP-glucose 4-epimerase
MTRVLLTGAGGYIGSRLAADLAPLPDVSVRALVRKPASFVEADEHVVVDLLGDHESIAHAFAGIDTVVHLAGPNEVVAAAEPERALTETVLVSERVADASAAAGVARIVYVSTVHAYGALMVDGANLTEDQPAEPRSVYAIARLASEHLLEAVTDRGIEVVVFRLTNSVGAPAHPDVNRWSLVTNDLCRQAVTRGELRLRSAGVQWRDFVALADACRILTGCLDPGSLPSGTYNLSSGVSHTIRQLVGLVQDAVVAEGAPRPPLHAPDPPASLPQPYHVPAGRLAAAGWQAEVPLAQAVAETVRFCFDHRDQL